MRVRGFPSAVLAAAVALACSGTARAHERNYVGLQLFAVAGVHKDVAGTQYGAGLGPLLQARVGGRRLAFRFEGIPVVAIPQRASAYYGQATPSIGIFNATLGYRIVPRLSVGVGETVIDQRTPLPNLQQVVSSRLAGVRYAFRYTEPLRAHRTLEANLGVVPTLWGSDVYVYSDGITPPTVKAERAAEIDASLAIGFHRSYGEMLVGLRALNFSAKYTVTGLAGDRNAGVGLFVEFRKAIP